MRIVHTLLVFAAAALIESVVIAGQTPPAKPAARPAARSAPSSPYAATATVMDLMAAMIDPASKVVFGAVKSVETPAGVQEQAPQTEQEWTEVRRNALLMIEGANLLLIPGRHIAPPQFAKVHNEGELPPSEIEVRVAKDRAAFNKFAVAFRQAAMEALKASEARKPEDFGPASEAIDTACENCHLRFWYPEQEELLKNAPKPGL
jgi:hypothetical protein